ncbi:hypothetical protein NSE01_30280 [Novosphingobium sediminis]|uniref:MFS transporter n=1 Tax=Novosphingobium sediminis TaxID=707214 RepID=A0A512AND1_9SPHN|nr:hypothetical protein [Novosphingobium sediminis]GEO01196.1 hypothetical protein NSE01_30280 [Novosphingobium sediminis]
MTVLALQAAGLFYFITAFLAMRAAATGGLIDTILGALSPAEPAEARAQTRRRRWLTWGAVLNGWAGAALALRWDGAVLLMAVAAAAQWLYLLDIAPRHLDPYDPPDPAGRRSTRNAALGFTGISVVAIMAFMQDLLVPFGLLIVPLRFAAIGSGILLAGYAFKLERQSRFG